MRGFSVRQIPMGKPAAGVKVVRLHYSADPSMTAERVAKLKSKYPDESTWNREMEIDDRARSGQKIFSPFDRSIHVVESKLPIKPDEMTIWQAADPHPRTANAYVWLGVYPWGQQAVIWSWWPKSEPKRTINKYAERLKLYDEHLCKPYRRLMDIAGKSFDAEQQKDFFEAFRTAKDEKGKPLSIVWQPAKKNFDWQGYNLINQALHMKEFLIEGQPRTLPGLVIWAGCGDNDILIDRLEMIRWREYKLPVDDRDAPEEPEDKDKHLIDCLSYIELDSPRFIEHKYVEQQRNLNVVMAHGNRKRQGRGAT